MGYVDGLRGWARWTGYVDGLRGWATWMGYVDGLRGWATWMGYVDGLRGWATGRIGWQQRGRLPAGRGGRGGRGQPAVVGRRCRRIPCRARALPRWRPTGRGPAADLEHPTPSHVTEQPDVGLIESFRTPDEAGRARLVATEEAPVLGKVCVGIAVPPPPVGRGRRGRPDRPVADRAAVIRFVHVAHRRSPST